MALNGSRGFMQTTPTITFRDLEHSPEAEARVNKEVAKLERVFGRIVDCRVVIEAPHRQHTKGRVFHVGLDINVPGGQVIVSHDNHDDHAHEDLATAIRDAFRAARRQLDGHAAKRRGEVKSHAAPPHGRVARLFPERDFGFIEGADGQEVYFHRNSVINAKFDALEPGTEVRYSVESGDEGLQATGVAPIGKHHPD